MLPKSIATVCLAGSLPDKLEAAAAAGFQGVEIFENDLLTYDGSPAEVGRMCADLGLAVTIFQPFRDFEAMPEPQRSRNLDRAQRKFDTMQALGTDLLLVCSNTQAACLPEAERAAADLRAMAEAAAARGLRVGFEALAWGRHTSRWRQAWGIVQAADHPALGLILDSFHTLCLGDDLAGLDAVPAAKLFFLQLADAPRLQQDVLSWSRHHRLFPFQGELPVAEFHQAALAAGYAGPISLEIFNDDFRAAPTRRTARDAMRSLVLLEDAVPSAGVPAAPLPATPQLSGIEFVEFAVDEAAGAALGGMLGTLGFRLAGRHRSKQVALYRQGAVNLVLNSEPDSAAAERFQMFGPSVCAMALRVDEPARALARAEALLSPSWRERTGAGEQAMPAIRAPDGTLLHFVPTAGQGRFWADDFQLLDLPPQEMPGFTGIDHVVQALAPGALDGFVLFYRAVLGMRAEALWELPDPHGIIRSRTMVSPERSLRLPLNTSESRETATGRFISAYAGAGVHHIAFACADAAALVGAAAGAPLLDMPANYYDDLEARFGLEPALLARLRQEHLLYDRDAGGGEFLHAYTQSFQDRCFFEVTERRGGYDQYGAPNAAVRLAAQARRGRRLG